MCIVKLKNYKNACRNMNALNATKLLNDIIQSIGGFEQINAVLEKILLSQDFSSKT